MEVRMEGLAGQAYAGVGSRSTPAKVLRWMESIGRAMAEAGMVLRSGAAEGADSAFERGCDSVGGDKRIYLPRAGFKGRRADGVKVLVGGGAWAQALGRKHHPAWDRLGGYVKLLMARNTHQVLGDEGARAPSMVVIGWTPGGKRGRGHRAGVQGGAGVWGPGGGLGAGRAVRRAHSGMGAGGRGAGTVGRTGPRGGGASRPGPAAPGRRSGAREAFGKPIPRLTRRRPPARTHGPGRYALPAGRARTAPANALDAFGSCKARSACVRLGGAP